MALPASPYRAAAMSQFRAAALPLQCRYWAGRYREHYVAWLGRPRPFPKSLFTGSG